MWFAKGREGTGREGGADEKWRPSYDRFKGAKVVALGRDQVSDQGERCSNVTVTTADR